MQDAIRDLWKAELDARRSPSGNVDVPSLISEWRRTAAWQQAFAGAPAAACRRALGGLGREVFDLDDGRYASELRWNVADVPEMLHPRTRDSILRAHCELLMSSLADHAELRDPARAAGCAGTASVVGLTHVKDALSDRRGAVLLGANLSHPGFLLHHPVFSKQQVLILQAASPDGPARAFRISDRLHVYPAAGESVRPVLAHLAKGGIAMCYGDHVPSRSVALPAVLFGKPAPVSSGLLSLMRISRSPVVPFAIARHWPLARDHVEIRFFPVLRGIFREPAGARSAANLGQVVEALIRQYPKQWTLWNALRHHWRLGAGLSPSPT